MKELFIYITSQNKLRDLYYKAPIVPETAALREQADADLKPLKKFGEHDLTTGKAECTVFALTESSYPKIAFVYDQGTEALEARVKPMLYSAIQEADTCYIADHRNRPDRILEALTEWRNGKKTIVEEGQHEPNNDFKANLYRSGIRIVNALGDKDEFDRAITHAHGMFTGDAALEESLNLLYDCLTPEGANGIASGSYPTVWAKAEKTVLQLKDQINPFDKQNYLNPLEDLRKALL